MGKRMVSNIKITYILPCYNVL
uniref:Uncharacterized protein n=1 Tax=Anguilla anguilla TaxID=7936 RepID=A0A0E9S309_ANGAN